MQGWVCENCVGHSGVGVGVESIHKEIISGSDDRIQNGILRIAQIYALVGEKIHHSSDHAEKLVGPFQRDGARVCTAGEIRAREVADANAHLLPDVGNQAQQPFVRY